WPVDASPKHLEEALHGSLKRLKVEQIDLYQLHRIDDKVPVEDTFRFLQKAQQDGLVKHIGLSEVDVNQIKKAQEFFPVVNHLEENVKTADIALSAEDMAALDKVGK
nr:hypothetical protein [Tanacetum cinerariifolium]